MLKKSQKFSRFFKILHVFSYGVYLEKNIKMKQYCNTLAQYIFYLNI
jgi:hypothetical protein